jgi:hypothetical protein
MTSHHSVLYVFALVFFCIAAVFNPTLPAATPWYGRFHFGWAGLAVLTATLVFS